MNLDKKLNGKSAVKKNSIQIFAEATSHEINTTIKYHDIIIFAQLLSEYNNLSSGGMEHRQNSWLIEGWCCMSWRYKNLILVE